MKKVQNSLQNLPQNSCIMHTGKANLPTKRLTDPAAVSHLRGKIPVLYSPPEHRQLKNQQAQGRLQGI